jgi:hypothetical protein
MTRATRWILVGLGVAAVVLIGLYLAATAGTEAWDDAYFFARVGRNLLAHGSLAWNTGDGPVYGNTSQGYQLAALVPLVVGAGGYYVACMRVLAGLALFGLGVVYARTAEEPFGYGLAWLGAGAPFTLLLLVSAMETHVAMLVLAACLVAIARARRPWVIVAWVVAVYLMRPDAVVIPLTAIVATALFERRRPDLRLLGACALALAAVLGVMWLYFGTPVPLAFYLKTRALTHYAPEFVAMDLVQKHRNLVGWSIVAAPLLFVIAHARAAWPRALAVAAAVFVAYHYLATVEVMAYHARFYLPALVPLTLGAIAAASAYRERARPAVTVAFVVVYAGAVYLLYRTHAVYGARDAFDVRVPGGLYAGYVAAAALVLLAARLRWAVLLVPVPLLASAAMCLGFPSQLAFRSDRTLIARHVERYTTWRGIGAVQACLPEPLGLYHTEIGVPGILFPDSTVTDLAGLMDRRFARGDADFDARCQHDRPEVIFLPHRNYKAQRAAIEGGACLRDYQRVVSDSSSPLYVRRDLAPAFVACARAHGDRWVK